MSELTPAMREALQSALAAKWPNHVRRFGCQEEEIASFLAGVAYAESDCERRIAEAVAIERERAAKECDALRTAWTDEIVKAHLANDDATAAAYRYGMKAAEDCAAAIRAEPKGGKCVS